MKKKIPLAILEALQPIANDNLGLVKVKKDPDSMFHLIDVDDNSDFYFKVSKQEMRSGKLHYRTQYKPGSRENINENAYWLTLENILSHIKKWLEVIKSYNEIYTIYDDPILVSNQKRFELQFDIVDKDSDTASFNLEQQIYLDDYLNSVKSKVLYLQEGRSKEQVQQLQELVEDATEIQNHLTTETKRKIIKRLSKLWAKSQKIGLDVIKEIFISVAADLTKRLLIGQ